MDEDVGYQYDSSCPVPWLPGSQPQAQILTQVLVSSLAQASTVQDFFSHDLSGC